MASHSESNDILLPTNYKEIFNRDSLFWNPTEIISVVCSKKNKYTRYFYDGTLITYDSGLKTNSPITYMRYYTGEELSYFKCDSTSITWSYYSGNVGDETDTIFDNLIPTKKTSVYLKYYTNGQLQFYKQHRNGLIHGFDIWWKEDGSLHDKKKYADGVLVKDYMKDD